MLPLLEKVANFFNSTKWQHKNHHNIISNNCVQQNCFIFQKFQHKRCTPRYYKWFSKRAEWTSHPFGLIHAKRVLCFFAFSDLPSAILAKLNSATTLLASTTLYIYKNVIIIFQYETKAKTTENRSGVRWQLINRPWFVAWADGDGSKGEVQNKFCYILQNKNQKNYWGAPGPLGFPQ